MKLWKVIHKSKKGDRTVLEVKYKKLAFDYADLYSKLFPNDGKYVVEKPGK